MLTTEEQPKQIFIPRWQYEKAQSGMQHPCAKRNLVVSLFGNDMKLSVSCNNLSVRTYLVLKTRSKIDDVID